jgi:phosphate transport system substrate-binding protein
MATCPNPQKCPKEYLTRKEGYCTQCGMDLSLISPPFPWRKVILATIAVILFGGLGVWGYQKYKVPPPPPPKFELDKLLFTLSGSNTIGAELAPALASGFLKKQYQVADSTIKTTVENEKDKIVLVHGKDPSGKVIGIRIMSAGSGKGFEHLEKDSTDIGMSSRPIKDEEVQKLATLGAMRSRKNAYVIGNDGIAVIVHPDNSLSQETIAGLSQLFSGQTPKWSATGSPIRLVVPDAKSGTWELFNEKVLKPKKLSLSDQAMRDPSMDKIVYEVSKDKNAIGVASFKAAGDAKGKVKMLAVADGAQAAFIVPSEQSIGSKDYVLNRDLYFYFPDKAVSKVSAFKEYVLSNEGQQLVLKHGFVGVTTDPDGNILASVTPNPSIPYPSRYSTLTQNRQKTLFNISFLTGSYVVDNKGITDLERAAAVFKARGLKALLIGFADSQGNYAMNTILSQHRAGAVKTILESKGVECVLADGFGQEVPIGDNTTDEGRSRNRRAEIWAVTPDNPLSPTATKATAQ